jgi:acyl-CoA synthetase (NDP forming)
MSLTREEFDRIDVFFHPRSAAVVGASENPAKFGYQVVRNLINLRYPGRVYPIHPTFSQVQGFRAFRSVLDVPDTIDVAVMAVPSHVIPGVMRECEQKSLRNIVILASGFDEAGAQGKAYQREVLEVAKRSGMRIVGPNTTGILNPSFGFTSTFVPLDAVRVGEISFISQTGMFAGMMMEWIVSSQQFGFRKVAGLGNKCDVADHEILDYLAQDDGTKVILIHMEGARHGGKFFEALREVTRTKPVVVLKTGRSTAGARAASSHSASLAGDDQVFDAMLKQAGAIRAESLEDLVDLGKAFCYLPLPRGDGASAISLSGGACVMSADALERGGFSIKTLKTETLAAIREKSPVWANPSNPVDIEPLTETVGFVEGYTIGLEALLSDGGVDSCIVQHGNMFRTEDQIRFIFEARERHPDTPIAVCILGDRDVYDELFVLYERNRVPVFPTVERAARALAALNRRRHFLARRSREGRAGI